MGNSQEKLSHSSSLQKRWNSTQTQLSFSSFHSGYSSGSNSRSRISRSQRNHSLPPTPQRSSKTSWPLTMVETMFLPDFSPKGQLDQTNFEVLKEIARGAFGSVFRVRMKDSGKEYAMKVLSKAQVIREAAVKQCKDEVSIQSILGHHPFIVQCSYSWQTKKQLFIVTEYVPNGDLYMMWKKYGNFGENLVRIIIAELALVLDFLHNSGVIYRDLKMENVLLDAEGHIQLIDFGLARWLSYCERANTICGTIQYMAPEILSMKPYTYAVDWWSLGIMMYALITGHYPVEACKDHVKMKDLVTEYRYTLPDNCSEAAKSVVKKLLCKLPQRRLQSLHQLKWEPFFRDINFDDIRSKKVSPKAMLEAESKKETCISWMSGFHHSNIDKTDVGWRFEEDCF